MRMLYYINFKPISYNIFRWHWTWGCGQDVFSCYINEALAVTVTVSKFCVFVATEDGDLVNETSFYLCIAQIKWFCVENCVVIHLIILIVVNFD